MSLFSRLVVVTVLSIGIHSSVLAQDPPKTGEAKSSAVVAEYPFVGEITCEALNIRLAPNKEAGTAIAAILKLGEKVTVIADSGKYFVVSAPRGAAVWVLARHIKKDSDSTGTALSNDIAVRIDSRANAEKLGSLNDGERVTILKEHLGWYQISAPADVKYYASKEYIRFVEVAKGGGDTKVPVAPKPSADGEAKAMIKQAESLMEEQNKLIAERKITDLDYSGAIEAYDQAAKTAKSADIRKHAESSAKALRNFQTLLVAVKGNLDATNKLVDGYRDQLREKWEVKQPKWDNTGYVDTVGKLHDRPGTYKLVMADKVVCFISVKEDDTDMKIRLNGFFGRYVGIRGAVTKDPVGWEGYTVVAVETIEEISK